MSLPPIPSATQPQIIRAHQKDLFNVFYLREETENVLRAWLGTRWLTRWEKEVELLAKLAYYGLTTLRGTQTLGEEYVDIRPLDVRRQQLPSTKLRAALILLPTLPSYLLSRFSRHLPFHSDGYASSVLKALPSILEALTEFNLASFYITGSYYGLVNRLLRVRHMASTAPDPNFKPPSYSFLGILLSIRLVYRLYSLLHPFLPSSRSLLSRSHSPSEEEENTMASKESFIDDTPISTLVPSSVPGNIVDAQTEEDAWGDRTILHLDSIDLSIRAGRKCALCLEERTASSVTECGHVFCWTCIVGWAREKAECPLCRQSLALSRILPLYNM